MTKLFVIIEEPNNLRNINHMSASKSTLRVTVKEKIYKATIAIYKTRVFNNLPH